MNHVSKLTNVAWPRMASELGSNVICEFDDLVLLLGVDPQEVVDQQVDVSRAFTQGRNRYHEPRQAVIEVEPKLTG